MKGKKNIRLPKEFKKYFWDVEFNKISFAKHVDLILSRLLSLGNMKDIRWLLKKVGAAQIKNFVLRSGGRQLDRRSNNFWRVVFGLTASQKPINPMWPY